MAMNYNYFIAILWAKYKLKFNGNGNKIFVAINITFIL